jgi:hypothetical protein
MQKLSVPGKSSGARTEKEAVGVLLLHVGDYVLSQDEGMATVVAHLLRLVLAYDSMCSLQANTYLILSVLWIRIQIDFGPPGSGSVLRFRIRTKKQGNLTKYAK